MPVDKLSVKVENERLFGPSVDLFKSYHASLSICNILKNIGVATSNDSDWFRAVAEFISVAELSAVYDKILPREQRETIAKSRYRTPPELQDDDPDDVLRYLATNIVHRKKLWCLLAKIYEKRVEEYKKLLENPDRNRSAVEKRFSEFQELFDLSELEIRILTVIFLSATRFVELGDFDVTRFRSSEKVTAIARAVGVPDIAVASLLEEQNNITKFGLVDCDLDIDRTFLSYLCGISSTPLADRFWTKYPEDAEVLPWEFFGRLTEKNGAVLKKMIEAKNPDKGLGCLLYGIPGSGKSSFAVSLAAATGKTLYFIAQNDNDTRRMTYSANFRYAALAVAQKQLDPECVILAVDECDRMVSNNSLGGGLLSRLFGGEEVPGARDGESKGQLNTVMDQNKHTILWICNSRAEEIDPSSRRRFDYNIYFDQLSASSRSHIWKNALKYHDCEGALSDIFIQKISLRWPVNPGGIAVAVRNAAALCRKNPELKFEDEVMVFLKAHCQLLGIQESPEEYNEPALDYNLEGLNIRSGIKLDRLIQVCRNYLENSDIEESRDKKSCALILHGVPGAGKSEFAKYLAKQLGRKLCVKKASDLLNKYVGGTEERIANAFSEAELNQEILVVDEVDSMLSSRQFAHHQYEVSQVNTLLAEMERFRGIFIATSNLLQRIDPAALRRFNFRVHFDYLKKDGIEKFYETYFTKPMTLKKLSEQEKMRLLALDKLTPSDFRNVRQQFFYLGDNGLTNTELIEALEAEVAAKNSGSSYKGLGEVVQKMGF